jgi:hypothetical protein
MYPNENGILDESFNLGIGVIGDFSNHIQVYW